MEVLAKMIINFGVKLRHLKNRNEHTILYAMTFSIKGNV